MAIYRHVMPLLTDQSSPGTSWVANEKGQLRLSEKCTGFIGFGPPRKPFKALDSYRLHFGVQKTRAGDKP